MNAFAELLARVFAEHGGLAISLIVMSLLFYTMTWKVWHKAMDDKNAEIERISQERDRYQELVFERLLSSDPAAAGQGEVALKGEQSMGVPRPARPGLPSDQPKREAATTAATAEVVSAPATVTQTVQATGRKGAEAAEGSEDCGDETAGRPRKSKA